jgi:carbon-monoxide dehydrogenase catalytic subunit
MALSGLDDLVGACFLVEPDLFKATAAIEARIIAKRQALGLSA